MKIDLIVKNKSDVDRAIHRINEMLGTSDLVVSISEAKNLRSLAINRLYWMNIGQMVGHITDTIGEVYSQEAMHEQLKKMFVKPIVFEFKNSVIKKYSTSKLSNKAFCEYLEKIDQYCADRLNLILSKPQDLYNEAMGRK